MDFGDLQRNWDELGSTDPYWAILSVPTKKGGKWDAAEFFETGVRDIEAVVRSVSDLGLEMPSGRALDFGCGVGRLTQALAPHFEHSVGVDIAPSMIELANRFNRWGERCEYKVNEAPDLRAFRDQSFDFILSLIVLQHMRPAYAQGYVSEFMRLLKPGGITIFQVPSSTREEYVEAPPAARRSLLQRIRSRVRRQLPGGTAIVAPMPEEPTIEMHGLNPSTVEAVVTGGGCRLVSAVEDQWAGREWTSYTYTVTRSTA